MPLRRWVGVGTTQMSCGYELLVELCAKCIGTITKVGVIRCGEVFADTLPQGSVLTAAWTSVRVVAALVGASAPTAGGLFPGWQDA